MSPIHTLIVRIVPAGARFVRGISLTGLLGSPWIRFQPVAARVVAERGQNAPVESLESLKGYAALWDALGISYVPVIGWCGNPTVD